MPSLLADLDRDRRERDWRRFDLEPTRELVAGRRLVSFRWIRIEDLDRAFAIIKRMHARGSVGDYALVSPERIVIEVKGSAPLGIEEGLAELGELDVVPYPETESDVEEGAPVEELDGVVTTREIHRPNGDGEHLRDDEGQGE